MGVLADRLDRLVFTVHSPDRQISATLSDRDHVDLRFQPGAYRRYDERALAHQLTRLAVAAWVESQRQYRAVFSEATGEPFSGQKLVRGSMRHRYHGDLTALEAEGWSGSGWVGIWTQGLTHWDVMIMPGAIRSLTQDEFAAELAEAVQSLLTSHRWEVYRLRNEHFDLQLPDLGS
jgi:hypothetical protein